MRQTRCLTSWNRRENFASLGIGHFIWYPKDEKSSFEETFPALLQFLCNKGATLPDWLNETDNLHCPWQSHNEFEQNFYSERMVALRKFLKETVSLQAKFLVQRLKNALPQILAASDSSFRTHIQKQFFRLAKSSNGLYALVDYVNFKGSGSSMTERYKGEGWGLLQVLQEMRGEKIGIAALKDFSKVATTVLTRRVKNAPEESNDHKWLNGWKRRIRTYLETR